ncbi:MAG: caspase family protein [Bacteroidales bacterium]|jgi:WD40 repeat protein|nr:caspase family protein [Bacteroidales bacterium]
MKKFICIICFVLCKSVVAQPSDPILQLNSGFHTAPVRSVSTDREGRYLLTASEDKTARLWDARTGAALRIFRPPIAYGLEGSLYAGALSPDGQTAAVGGHTGASWNKADSAVVTVGNWKGYARKMKYSVYLFSTATGEMTMHIDGLEGEVHDLKYAPSGDYLAVALGDARGVVVFNTKDGTELRRLIGYGGDARRLAFSPSGRWAVVADDGYLRLYDSNFRLTAVRSLDGRPSGVVFLPDESVVAVSCEDKRQVLLFNALTGDNAGAFQPSLSAVKGITALACTPDGAIWSGVHLQNNSGVVTVWKNSRRTEIPAASAAISDISALPDGSMVFATLWPETGRITSDCSAPTEGEENTERAYLKKAEIRSAPFRQQELFQLNDDGTEIGLKGVSRDVLFFSLATRMFRTGANSYPRATASARDLTVAGWKNNTNLTLNGQPLNILDEGEISRCTDIAADGTCVLTGTNQHVICLDRTGGILWKRSLPAECVAVKIAGNGRVAAAALDNGMYLWLDMKEGMPLITLFAHPDNTRWVLWTPDGYYDCAAGAEDLIGWNLNQGQGKAAAFYPVARFRSAFYRPDMIDRLLQFDRTQLAQHLREEQGTDTPEEERPNIAQTLPPEVRIVSPQPESSVNLRQVKVNYLVDPSGKEPVESVKILVDGRPVQLLTFIREGNNEATVDIPDRDCEISVIAKNKFASGVPATIRVKWTGAREENLFKPKLYILAVGISQYRDKNLTLQYAAKDAGDFARVMTKQRSLLYGDVQVKLLTDHKGSKTAILEGLEWIQRETTSKDVAMIFFAGHGLNDNAGTFFYMPVEADVERLRSTCVNYMEIKQTVASVAGKVILFMDACHSGSVMGNTTRRSAIDINGIINELSSAENGVIVFTSSTGRQYSLENVEWNNGAFTKALVEGIDGKADLFGRNQISIKTLDAYITQRVKDLTKGQQAPTTIIPSSIPDFPIAITQ